jgi:hypothetical protein
MDNSHAGKDSEAIWKAEVISSNNICFAQAALEMKGRKYLMNLPMNQN